MYLAMNPIQLTFCFKVDKFFEINPMNTHEAAQIPMLRNKTSALKYSNIIPVNPIEIAVVPMTDIWIIEKSLPRRLSVTFV